ncbi:mitochondrial protein mpt family [Nannochloropsis oceanica]
MEGREPCPYRIVDDVGGAFCMGSIGGGIWHYFKGVRNAPKGERLRGGISSVKARAPLVGGAFAVWGLCFASFDCSIAAVRKKEDPWNAILSGACTGGLLAIRAGPKAAGKNAVIGGLVLAMIEGASIAITKFFAPPASTPEMGGPAMPDPTLPPTGPGMLSGFGGGGGGGGYDGSGSSTPSYADDPDAPSTGGGFDTGVSGSWGGDGGGGGGGGGAGGMGGGYSSVPEPSGGGGGSGWFGGMFGGSK